MTITSETCSSLSESETADLVASTQNALQAIACAELPDDYVCLVDVISIDGQLLTRRLRAESQRHLIRSFILRWRTRVSFPVGNGRSNAEDDAISVSTSTTNRLTAAMENKSLLTSIVANSASSAISSLLSLSSTSASLDTEPVQVELKSSSASKKGGGVKCKKDNECASGTCEYRGGGCKRFRKCCTVRFR